MKQKHLLFFLLFFLLLGQLACSSAGGTEPVVEDDSVSEPIDNEPGDSEPVANDAPVDTSSVDDCPAATAGAHQLLYAAQGVCFLYPDNYDVFQSEDGSLTLYVRSLLNTEAPLATVQFAEVDGRSIQEIIPDYPSDAELATMSFLTIELGEEQATVLDNLPGQDINRRIIAVHNDRLIDIMVARIGPEYGPVGEQAEALYQMITSSFQFIGIEPEAPLLAGPECPEAPVGTTLFTNADDGYCLLLPDGYAVDDSLTSNNGGGETAVYVDSLMDSSHARLFITVDAANGRTLEEITNEKLAEIETILGSSPVWSFGLMLDGVPANQFDQVPGQDFSRQVVLVHNDRLITLTFIPDEPAAGDAYTEMETMFTTVLDSFSFLRGS